MKTGKIFSGTISFCWLKLALGLAYVLIGALLFAATMGLAMLFGSGEMGVVMFFIWAGTWGFAHWIIKHYLGYLVKAGHVAVIAQSFKEGAVPVNTVSTGIVGVKERFATSNVYFTAAETTEITYDLYGKLSGFSGKFKELFRHGETARETTPAHNGVAEVAPEEPADAIRHQKIGIKFCPQCGKRHEMATKYCEACGAPQ